MRNKKDSDSPPGFLGRLARALKPRTAVDGAAAASAFRARYDAFQRMLESNTELLEAIAGLETLMQGHEPFGLGRVRVLASRAVFHGLRMAKAFEDLSGKPQPRLREFMRDLGREIGRELEDMPEAGEGALVVDLAEVGREDTGLAGGKLANLGEIAGRVGLPVPDGFGVSTAGYRLLAEPLWEEIKKRKLEMDPADPASVERVSEEIQALILSADFPEPLYRAMRRAFDALAERSGIAPEELRVALRSSAVGEDGEHSFAGQYLSVLGVGRDRLLESYRYVAASLYTPRALAYRLLTGVSDGGAAMAVACLRMVPAMAGGVLYTADPLAAPGEPGGDRIVIQAVWGLGGLVVDGSALPDEYLLDRQSLAVVHRRVAEKPERLVPRPSGGVASEPTPDSLRGLPCLDDGQARTLAEWGLRLEKHFGGPQDVEWALDQEGRLAVLQSRPLATATAPAATVEPPASAEVLIQGADTASAGAGAGQCHHVLDDTDLSAFPDRGVLVAPHSSPKFMLVMARASAVVTEHGGVTGHMASLAREFNVPALVGAAGALARLFQGREVTVDASAGRVYAGRVPEILARAEARAGTMVGTPVHDTLGRVAALITPLRLTDPQSPDFTPEGCSTLHDAMRYLHEMSYPEMFAMGDMASDRQGPAVRLDAPTGLDLRVIDLGGGLAPEVEARRGKVALGQVLSRPFQALLRGLCLDEAQASTPRPVHLGGFMSVLGQQMLGPPAESSSRFGERSYAVISDKYLNFSSRVGYHYGVLDSYTGRTLNKNYAIFSFQGGAAAESRRGRRARAIAEVLRRLGFAVEVNGDRVTGRFLKYEAEVTWGKLTSLGRLLQYTRQADMLMADEASVEALVRSFFAGDPYFQYKPGSS